ncbi:protein HEXIM-like, partial [Diaphorina citri]
NILSSNLCKEREEKDGVIGQTTVALSSCDNADSGPSGGNTKDRVERKKKTRRGKPKGKNYKPYNKLPKDIDMKMKRSRQRCNSRLTYEQPEAPNNSNQFIIEDHNFDQIPLIGSPERPNQRKCYRDSSFTSVESDGENFYSSPEDEVDYIIQDFSVTYKNLREESLNGMSKNDLIRQVLTLEERIENLVKKKKGAEDEDAEDKNESEPPEKIKALECENTWLKKEVERLTTENTTLRRRCRSSESSIDSESDSSSSSSSSDSSTSSSKPNSPVPVLVNGAAHQDEAVSMEEDLVEVNVLAVESNVASDKPAEKNDKPAQSNGINEKSTNNNA